MPAYAEMKGQDWSTVSFGKPAAATPAKQADAVKQARREGGAVLTERKHNGGVTNAGLSARALDAETEELKHQTVSSDLRTAIMKARAAKGLTQKQLAQSLNLQPAVIAEYERGTAIPNNAVIARIEKAVGARLPRAPKK